MTASSNPALTAAHILIAEDSPVQAYMLRHILEEQGAQVSVASNGRTALDLAVSLRPTVVVSDVNMPEMSGYELCRQIKAHPDLGATPVILVTTMSEPDDVLLGLQSGADSFVIKPYDKSHLLARVQHALAGRSAPPSAPDEPPVNIVFHGQTHQITANRGQILDLLMSTYDATVQRNKELHESREQLSLRSAELVVANNFLDSMIENLPNPIYLKDAVDLRYVRINRAAEQILGVRREQVIGKTAYELFEKNEADTTLAQDQQVLASRAVVEIPEHRLTSLNHGEVLLHTRKAPILNHHSEVTHILGITEDITQQKAMEKEILSLNAALRIRAEDLQDTNKSLESFTAAATHDLRSPLAVIGGYAGLLESKYASRLDEKGRRYLYAIRKNVQNLSQLIDDLLAFSKLGRRAISKATVDMQGLAHQVVAEMLQFYPEDKKPKIELGVLPPAPADATLLRQVWVNLLSNAVKYSSRATSPLIEVSGRIDDAEAVYSVRDNGAGFSMDHYDKLFEMFQRLHTDDEFDGHGVGLPIVHRVVTRHGGRVWAEGKVGQGAVFHFALPV